MEYAIKVKFIISFHNSIPEIIENGIIIVENGLITAVGENIDVTNYELFIFDHHVLIPGLINTHTHTAMTIFRGYADDLSLNDWLTNHIWPLEGKLTYEDIRIGSRIAAFEAMLSGTTTVNSMYWSPEAEAKSFSELGLRAMIGPPIISDINSLKSHLPMIPEWHGSHDDMIRVSLNPHAPYTVTDEDYISVNEYKNRYNSSNKIPLKVHTHLAESNIEMDLIKKYAEHAKFRIDKNVNTPVEYFKSLGILNQDMIAAHVVECNDNDIRILVDNDVGLSINPESNMKLGNNTPNISYMIDNNAKLGMGTDGPASNNSLDMFETMKLTSLLQKSRNNDASKGKAFDTLQTATFGGSRVLGWNDIGAIKVGMKADIILINLNKSHLKPVLNSQSIISHLVYSAKGSDVSDVMINGIWKVKDRKIIGVDLNEEYDKFINIVKSLHDRNFS